MVNPNSQLYYAFKSEKSYKSSFFKYTVDGRKRRVINFTQIFNDIGLTESKDRQLQNTLIGQA